MLFSISMMNIGDNYAYDLPQAYQTPLRDQYGISTSGTQLLYSVYSLPNTFMPIIGGIIISKYGDRVAVLLFSMTLLIGNIIFSFGIWGNNYSLMILGRLIGGIGGENMITVQMVCVEKWFSDTYLSLALGICFVMSYSGTMCNSFFTPLMIESLGSIFHTQFCIMLIVSYSQMFCYFYVVAD